MAKTCGLAHRSTSSPGAPGMRLTFLWVAKKSKQKKPPRTPSPDDRVPSLSGSFNPAGSRARQTARLKSRRSVTANGAPDRPWNSQRLFLSPCDAAGAATANADTGQRVERSEWRRPGASCCCGGNPPLSGGQGARARFFAYFIYAPKESRASCGGATPRS